METRKIECVWDPEGKFCNGLFITPEIGSVTLADKHKFLQENFHVGTQVRLKEKEHTLAGYQYRQGVITGISHTGENTRVKFDDGKEKWPATERLEMNPDRPINLFLSISGPAANLTADAPCQETPTHEDTITQQHMIVVQLHDSFRKAEKLYLEQSRLYSAQLYLKYNAPSLRQPVGTVQADPADGAVDTPFQKIPTEKIFLELLSHVAAMEAAGYNDNGGKASEEFLERRRLCYNGGLLPEGSDNGTAAVAGDPAHVQELDPKCAESGWVLPYV